MAVLEQYIRYKVTCGVCHEELDFIIHDGIEPISEIAIKPCDYCEKQRKESEKMLAESVLRTIKKHLT
jgi:hypothetical protein